MTTATIKKAMKFAALVLMTATFSVATQAAEEDESRATVPSETRLSLEDVSQDTDIPLLRLNTQLGVTSMDYQGDSSAGGMKQELAGGITFDVGEKTRVIETGLTYFKTLSSIKSESGQETEVEAGYLSIPLMAKVYTSGVQDGLYIKGGVLTAFLVSTNQETEMKNLDLIASLGVGTKIKASKAYDFIVEGSFNRGLFDALRSSGNTYNQGFLLMGGLSFNL